MALAKETCAAVIEAVETLEAFIEAGPAEMLTIPASKLGVAGHPNVPEIAQRAIRICKGRLVVHENYVLPIVGGKALPKYFLEFHASKYGDVLADPGPSNGQISNALFVTSNEGYYHFFASHFPGLQFLDQVECNAADNAVRLVLAHPFPRNAGPLMYRLIPQFSAGRDVRVWTISPGIYDIENVIFPLLPPRFMPTVAANRFILPRVLEEAGVTDPIGQLGSVKLFVRRENTSTGRNLLNQSNVEAWCVACGYVPVNPGTMTMEEQVLLFARATHIVGVEGAAMTNIMFAVNARRIVMIASPMTRMDRFFQFMVPFDRSNFQAVYGKTLVPPEPHRNSDFVLPVRDVAALKLDAD